MALPSPTVLSTVSGYIPTAVRKVIFAPSVASTSAPTSAELTAGTELSNQVSDSSGWAGTSNTVDAPNMGSRWTSKVSGLISADDSSLTFVASKTSSDARSLFNSGADGTTPTSGYMVFCWEGIVSGGKCTVFPVQCTSVAPSAGIGDLATLAVSFAITNPPSGMIAVPTA